MYFDQLENENLINLSKKLSESLNYGKMDSDGTISLTEEQLKDDSPIVENIENENIGIDKAQNSLSKISGAAGGIIDLGKDVYTTSQTTNNNAGEGVMNTLNLTAKGATVGNQIAGPYGAAVGATAGFVYGAVDTIGDLHKKKQEERKENQKKFDFQKTQREKEQRIIDAEESLSKLKNLTEAQFNYLS